MAECPTGECKGMVRQIKMLEVRMDRVEEKQRDPRVWVALFGVVGIALSTAGSIIGTMLGVYAKAQGWF